MIKALIQDEKVIGAISVPVKNTGYIMYQKNGILTAAKIVPYHKLNKQQREVFNTLKEEMKENL